MKIHSIAISTLFLFLIISCKEETKSEVKTEVTASQVDSSEYIPSSWITGRVAKAKSKLEQSEAGKVVWNAMIAHGGLEKWYANGALAMRFNYQPLDGKTPRDSYQVIDTWGNRAVHTSMKDSTASFGWTGSEAWVKTETPDFFEYDTKFWAMTPLYLMGFPFVIDGDGVNLELLPQSNYGEKANDVVKVTFAVGTGDAPDDYYILHFDAETHQLIGTRYIVSYPEYFKDGGHSPEKFMEVGPFESVKGILLPTQLKTHWTVDGLPGEYITLIEMSDIAFLKDLEEGFFEVPKDAKVIEGL